MYAVLSPLEDPHIEAGDDVAWNGERGWLDEIANVARRRVIEEGRGEWSSLGERRGLGGEGTEVGGGGGDETEDALSDSNSDPYMTDWWPLGGRDVSVTFGGGGGEVASGWGEARGIEQIERVLIHSRIANHV
jgi:hypothetical protein